MIRISALGQRCFVLRLFWKDGRRRLDLSICINHADVTAAFVIVATANVKKYFFCVYFFPCFAGVSSGCGCVGLSETAAVQSEFAV